MHYAVYVHHYFVTMQPYVV